MDEKFLPPIERRIAQTRQALTNAQAKLWECELNLRVASALQIDQPSLARDHQQWRDTVATLLEVVGELEKASQPT